MVKGSWAHGALLGVLFMCGLVAMAAPGHASGCEFYPDSKMSAKYGSCAGHGPGCGECWDEVVVYKEVDSGGPELPLGPEFAVLLPTSSGLGTLPRGQQLIEGIIPGSPDRVLQVVRACSDGVSLFDALDSKRQPKPVPTRRPSRPRPTPAP